MLRLTAGLAFLVAVVAVVAVCVFADDWQRSLRLMLRLLLMADGLRGQQHGLRDGRGADPVVEERMLGPRTHAVHPGLHQELRGNGSSDGRRRRGRRHEQVTSLPLLSLVLVVADVVRTATLFATLRQQRVDRKHERLVVLVAAGVRRLVAAGFRVAGLVAEVS